MQLSERLGKIADFVTCGYRLADIGTDHAYIPIELVRTGRIPSAIAMDIGEGPLKRAVEHIQSYGLLGRGDGRVEARRSDGLNELKKGEADSILIAGMGGALTVRILSDGEDVLESAKELILSPHTEIFLVRRYLAEHGYDIVREEMVCDAGKYYTVMRAVHTDGGNAAADYESDEYAYLYGKLLLKERSPVFLEYIKEEKRKLGEVVIQMEKSGVTGAKLQEIKDKINYLNTIRFRMED